MSDTPEVRALRKKNHFSYDWWKYLVGMLVLSNFVYLLFAARAYTTPPQYVVDVYLVGAYTELVAEMSELEPEILAALPEDQQEVNFTGLMFGAGSVASEAGNTLEGTMGAQLGDVFIMQTDTFLGIAERHAGLNLDPYLQDGTVVLSDQALAEIGTVRTLDDAQAHVYAISAGQLEGLYRYGYNVEDSVILVASYSDNPDNAARVVNWMLQNMQEARYRTNKGETT